MNINMCKCDNMVYWKQLDHSYEVIYGLIVEFQTTLSDRQGPAAIPRIFKCDFVQLSCAALL